VLHDRTDLDDPSELRLSGSGPASSVAVLAKGGFMSGDGSDPARQAVLRARMSADIDTKGDAIDAAARAVGDRAFARTKSGSIASIAFAGDPEALVLSSGHTCPLRHRNRCLLPAKTADGLKIVECCVCSLR
jgi:hypothetical protein